MTPKADPPQKPKASLRVSASPREEKPDAPVSPPPAAPQEVVTLLPAHRHKMTVKEARMALRGKANCLEVQAMISLLQWGREDMLAASLQPELSGRAAGYYAGCAAALRAQEDDIRKATQEKD